MVEQQIQLLEPTVELGEAFLSMVQEYRAVGEDRYQDIEEIRRGDFGAFVRHLEDSARGVGLPDGYVPASTFWLVRDGRRVLGCSRLRHRLTQSLLREGGHIGYDIRPSERRKGYGTRILARTLERARDRGLRRVLVTCDTDNVASARIIQNNGGKFESEMISERSGKPVSRYWIELE